MPINPEQQQHVRTAFLAVRTTGELAEVLSMAYRAAYPDKEDPGISKRSLNYLAFHYRDRYRKFEIPKKSGGMRVIHAPMPKLKAIQRALNFCFQSVFRPHRAAYGFVPGRSIVDNAKVHVGHHFVYNVDLKDFFPSTSFRRVKTVLELKPFALTGDREPLAFLIANLCCKQDGNEGALPQGAPTSPTLTNVVCQRLDRKLHRLARQHSARYTRYADDLSFSSNSDVFTEALRHQIESIIQEEGYQINLNKVRLQSRHIRQEVTGLTVNEKVNVPRSYIKDLRYWLWAWKRHGYDGAMADFIDQHGAEAAVNGQFPRFEHVLAGKIAFLAMVRGKDDGMTQRFKQEFALLLEEHFEKSEQKGPLPKLTSEAQPTDQASEIGSDILNILQGIFDTWEHHGIDVAIESLRTRKPSSNEQD